ncbi:hypothetical protein Vretimale_6217 [Volvox reticuliferus]|uniref:Reverse transcriptase domain-containing protein n=1 Tax=Volvox reticuliferus TaxID=1737510 RepID=A0A8J4LLG6_9CHLO|nr:hypothetical protein Vretimale_6217 [Volvox reticuliferus]
MWDRAESPTVVNGLRVVVQPGKLRLCMNPMYINLFIRYQPLRYERIIEMMHYVRPDDFLYATDDKSGYWQLAMHPDAFRFLAFQWQGTPFYFPACAFGLAPACGWYLDMKLEVYRPMRERGARLTFLLDDHAAAATGPGRVKYLCRTVIMILSALGFTLSFKKSCMIPTRRP